jgi:protein-disulfide isomerase
MRISTQRSGLPRNKDRFTDWTLMTRYLWISLIAATIAFGQKAPAVSSDSSESVDLVVYSDFQCPFCRSFSQPVREVESKGADGIPVNVHYKYFPLDFHPDANISAQAAAAAAEQGKFWEMHDLLFANQSALKRDDLLGYAKMLGLDLKRFTKDLDSDRIKGLIKADHDEGLKRGVQGTPTFYVNGKEYSGTKSLPELTKLLVGDQRLKQVLAEIGEALMTRGPADAQVTLEFFADLESPVSRPAIAVIEQVMQKYPSTVRLQFRNFPLAFHPQATLAHDAAMAAAREGHFWDFANYILAHQDSLREQDLIAYAGQLGLNEAAFAETLQKQRYLPRVEADVEEGSRRGIRGSPVVFVNSKRIDGVPSLQTLTELVEAELAAK